MIVKSIITVLLSILAGFLYRFGGLGKEDPCLVPKWLRHSWIRDWLIPSVSLATLFLWWKPTSQIGYLALIPAYGLLGGGFSTYWDWINKYFGDNEDEKWYNWLIHGFFVGIAFFPFCFVGLSFIELLIRSVICGILMAIVGILSDNVWIEEFGRGIIANISRGWIL